MPQPEERNVRPAVVSGGGGGGCDVRPREVKVYRYGRHEIRAPYAVVVECEALATMSPVGRLRGVLSIWQLRARARLTILIRADQIYFIHTFQISYVF